VDCAGVRCIGDKTVRAPDQFAMMKSHRELLAWQRANTVAVGAQRYARGLVSTEYVEALDQLRRASLSAALNIAEGYACGRTGRAKNFFRIAYGSAVETTTVLEFLMETDAPNTPEVQRLHAISRETQALTLLLWRKAGGPLANGR
jgi:four helix bundle protein